MTEKRRRKLASFSFYGGFMCGLATEKLFVLAGWPDTSVVPTIVALVIGTAFICAAAHYYDNEEIAP